MSEVLFLTTLAVNAFNEQYQKSFTPNDFCIFSITPAPGFHLGYEIVSVRDGDFLRLRIYLNIGKCDQLSKYRLEVNHPSYENALGDEVYVALGEIDNYYKDSGMFKFNSINTCGILLNVLTDETGDPFTDEQGEYFVMENVV
jgi:hypothetical protein